MACLDLEELPALLASGGVLERRRWSACSFHRGDHCFDGGSTMEAQVRDFVERRSGSRPIGRIVLLTQLRHWGFYFSPLNLYFVFDPVDDQAREVVAEVSNTPWNERHCYLLWDGNRVGDGPAPRFAHAKEFHVSPFQDMNVEYRWRVASPGETLTVAIECVHDNRPSLDVGMTLHRRELTRPALHRATTRYPFLTARILASIYFQAFRLWCKKCPFYPHPRNDGNRRPSRQSAPASEMTASQPGRGVDV